jgi:hypothetical protein
MQMLIEMEAVHEPKLFGIAMPISKTCFFSTLQAVLLALFFHRSSTTMDSDPSSVDDWADHPCALITTPQYATKKVIFTNYAHAP